MHIVIKPGIGRKVWFYKSAQHLADCKAGLDQPYDATVVFVHNDRHVNLRVTDHLGADSPAVGVDLVQPADQLEANGPHARWMDYQVQQEMTHAARAAMSLTIPQNDSASEDDALHLAARTLTEVSADMQFHNASTGTLIAETDDQTGRITFPAADGVEVDTTAQQVESLSEQSDTAGNVPFAQSQALGEPL
jgi:hypothetical protein